MDKIKVTSEQYRHIGTLLTRITALVAASELLDRCPDKTVLMKELQIRHEHITDMSLEEFTGMFEVQDEQDS